jgi:site-specific DNA recombinase
MVHTYTNRGAKRYRYYVCYNAQQRGWNNCQTKSVPAHSIEVAVLDSIRRLGSDATLATAVATEAFNQIDVRRRELDHDLKSQHAQLRRLNQSLAHEAANTKTESGARFERMLALQHEIEAAESRLTEVDDERKSLAGVGIDADDLRRTMADFDAIWTSLTTIEQEQLIRLLISHVAYDGRTGKVTVSFNNTGAKELCQTTV